MLASKSSVCRFESLISSPAANARPDTLAVDVISDVVCPWCYIGKRKLEVALSELKAREPTLDIAVRWHPFQLNPDMPAGGMPRTSYLAAKFGGSDRAAEIYSRVRAVGAEVGIPFAFERIVIQPNTLQAHRLIAWAQARGDLGAVGALVEGLFHAYFIDGSFLGQREELVRTAAAAGFDPAEVRAVLASDEGSDVVAAEDREARSVGVQGVPFFIFNGRIAVSGAHDPPTLLDAIAAARHDR
jgi:predicted DsbA family dithiol-disulfide isomerase